MWAQICETSGVCGSSDNSGEDAGGEEADNGGQNGEQCAPAPAPAQPLRGGGTGKIGDNDD